MGLSIRAYGGVKLVKEKDSSIDCLWEWADEHMSDSNVIVTYINPHFRQQGRGLVSGVYTYTDSLGGFDRSYSGYSVFRELLARVSGIKPLSVVDACFISPSILDDICERSYIENKPYSSRVWYDKSNIYPLEYLINFSDSEGTINTKCCKAILEDLMNINECNPELESVLPSFIALKEIFKFAVVNEGFVVFS